MKSKRKPKPYRHKNAVGREIGCYCIKIDGREVNLRTSDANEADRRTTDAWLRGRRNFVDEIDEAAAAVDGGADAAAVATPPPAAATPAAAAAAAPQPTAAAPQPVQPDGYIPPPAPPLQLPAAAGGDDARAEAEATNDAAAEGETDADAGAAADQQLPPEVLDQFLEQGALVLVDLQLELQAAGIRKWRKKQPQPIAEDSPVRKLAAAAWVAQLKIWFPSDVMLPPWALALILPALCIPVQLATATDLPKKDAQPQADGAQPAAAEAA